MLKEKKSKEYVVETWKSIMDCSRLCNKKAETFTLQNLEEKSYGYDCKITIPHGLSFTDLCKKKDAIEDSFPCIVEMELKAFSNLIDTKLILEDIEPSKEAVNTEPHELFLGYGYDGTPIIADMKVSPHVLAAGHVGSGMSSHTFNNIVSILISNTNKENTEIYMLQVSKSDLVLYEKCEQVAYTAKDIDQWKRTIDHLEIIIRNRIKEQERCNSKDKIIYCIIDDINNLKFLKETQNQLRYIAQFGRDANCYIVAQCTRDDRDSLDPIIKNVITNKLASFGMPSNEQYYLFGDSIQRLIKDEFIVYKEDKSIRGKVPTISNEEIYDRIHKKIKSDHSCITLIEKNK